MQHEKECTEHINTNKPKKSSKCLLRCSMWHTPVSLGMLARSTRTDSGDLQLYCGLQATKLVSPFKGEVETLRSRLSAGLSFTELLSKADYR